MRISSCIIRTSLVGDDEMMGVASTGGKTTLAGPMTLGGSAGKAETIGGLELHVLR